MIAKLENVSLGSFSHIILSFFTLLFMDINQDDMYSFGCLRFLNPIEILLNIICLIWHDLKFSITIFFP